MNNHAWITKLSFLPVSTAKIQTGTGPSTSLDAVGASLWWGEQEIQLVIKTQTMTVLEVFTLFLDE